MMHEPLRILVPMHETLMPPDSIKGLTDQQIQPWKMEYDILRTLEALKHEVKAVGICDRVEVLDQAIEEFRPQVVFNLVEEFHANALFSPHVASFFELKKVRYTGCNPLGMMLSNDKGLSKKILAYHGIRVPEFMVIPMKAKVRRPEGLEFPLFVKSLTDDGSVGISQASIVHNDEQLEQRVEFVRKLTGKPVIAEQYIEGKDIYVAVLGNRKLRTFTPWELILTNLPEGAPNIATGRVKWSLGYQESVGVKTCPATLSAREARALSRLSTSIYRHLCLSGYARLDFRVDPQGRSYLLEANPNPNLSYGEDFAESAEHAGMSYEVLLQTILELALTYRPWK